MPASAKNVDDMYEIICGFVPVDKRPELVRLLLNLRGNASFEATIAALGIAHAKAAGDDELRHALELKLAGKLGPRTQKKGAGR
jgi:hypothetical protein